MFDYNDASATILDKVFKATVPSVGKAATLGGEYVRAIERITYRWLNDGDEIGIGYGRETVNPAARFVLRYCDANVDHFIGKMWGTYIPESAYEHCLQNLIRAAVADLDAHPEWFGRTDHPDMWELADPTEDVDDDWDDDDDDWDC